MNSKLLKLIIIVFIIIIFLILTIIILNLNANKDEIQNIEIQNEDLSIILEENSYLVKEEEIFYTIENSISRYISALQIKDNNYVMDVLDSEYIKNNNINSSNVIEKSIKVNEETTYNAEYVYAKDTFENSQYYVKGIITVSNQKNEIYFKVVFDYSNATYSIKPINEEEYEKATKNINDIKLQIKQNENNIIKYALVNDENIIFKYINKFRELCVNDVKSAYDILDEEYRTKRFGNFSNFEKYVKNNIDEISNLYMLKYNKETKNENTRYAFTDRFENMYIINELSPMQFTIILDTYTLEQEKYEQKYKAVTNKEKVMMNIDKFFQMLNANDYSSSYKLLNQNFKTLNFKTEESFEAFVKQYMYPHANVTYVKYSDAISGVYTYYIELTNKSNSNDSKVGMNIIMQLQEGTDFNLSFEIVN